MSIVSHLQQTRQVLGSQAVLTLVSDQLPTVMAAQFSDLWDQIETFEQRFSRFRSDSELTVFNQTAGKRQRVSTEFLALLRTAKQLAEQTDGLYNPFTLPNLQQAGYRGSWPHPDRTDPATDFSSRTLHPIAALELGTDWARIPSSGALDFGGIGKGYLLDDLAQRLLPNYPNFWLSIGGDITCAGYDRAGQPWRIGVAAANDSKEIIKEIVNKPGRQLGIATSGITKRHGGAGQGAWHHLIDPRSGQPAATDILTATVVTASALTADIYAKCLVILGSTEAKTFIQRHADILESLLQRKKTHVRAQFVGYNKRQT